MMTKQNSKLFLMLLLGVLSAFGPFVIDLYLPSLPNLAQYFATNAAMVQLTLTTGMLGLAVGQLFFGPISDKYGRRMPLLISLVVFVASTVLILFAPNIETLIALRLVQGLASSGSVVISRAVVADLYAGHEMTRFFGALMTINGLAPIISPVLGSLLLEYTDWRGMFAFLAVIGVLVLLACLRFRESLQPEKRITMPMIASFQVLWEVLKNRPFMLFVLIESFGFAAMFAYIAASPFVFQQFYGLSSLAFSLCFAANGAALVIGSNLGGRLANRRAVQIGVWGTLGFSLYVAAVLLAKANFWLVEFGFFSLLLALGVMMPALATLAMSAEKRYAGSASALIGFMVFLFGAVISPLVGLGDIFLCAAIAIAMSGLLTLICYWLVAKQID